MSVVCKASRPCLSEFSLVDSSASITTTRARPKTKRSKSVKPVTWKSENAVQRAWRFAMGNCWPPENLSKCTPLATGDVEPYEIETCCTVVLVLAGLYKASEYLTLGRYKFCPNELIGCWFFSLPLYLFEKSSIAFPALRLRFAGIDSCSTLCLSSEESPLYSLAAIKLGCDAWIASSYVITLN